MKLNDLTEWTEAINSMAALKSPYSRDYVFYLHMISQCRSQLSTEIDTLAVCFKRDHYELLVNEEFFRNLSLEERLGVIKHEMLHILHGHLTYQSDMMPSPKRANVAMDCAINQSIASDHLPQGCILPATFPSKNKCPDNLSSIKYYDLLEDQDEDNMPDSLDDHSAWGDSDEDGHSSGDPQVAKDIAKSMAEKSAAATQGGTNPGNVPGEYSDWINLLSTPREVNWKKVLRNIVGNKKANRRKTILRRDRRNPHMEHIKGKTKDRVFNLAIISDVSGSVSDEALRSLWGEILHICKQVGVVPTLCQIDTQAYEPQVLKANSSKLERKASGGTVLSPAIQKLKDTRTPFDALVVTTDGYLFDDDIQPFLELNKRVVWLVEPNGQLMPQMSEGKMIGIKLKENS